MAGPGEGVGNVIGAPAGINCPATCNANFDVGTAVTLTATSGSSSRFAGWSGDCTGTGTCAVTMDQVRNVTATFVGVVSLDLTIHDAGTDHTALGTFRGFDYYFSGGVHVQTQPDCIHLFVSTATVRCFYEFDRGTDFVELEGFIETDTPFHYILDHWSGCDSSISPSGTFCEIAGLDSDRFVDVYFRTQ